MSEPLEDDDFTELVDADIPRVDLVGKGANGLPFLIAKGQPGMLPDSLVRSLIGDRTHRPEAVIEKESDPVTISGSPAAVAKMIHEAARRAPVSTPPNEDGATMTDAVIKADEPVGEVEVEVTDVVADAPGGGTAETVPGSPDWEHLDASTAYNAIGVLARVKSALEWLSEREATETVAGDPGDEGAVFDLADAAGQLDDIIRRLAGYATTETLEAEMDDELAEVGKAAAGEDLAGALLTLERYGPVVKAGRVLSAANEAAIRSASASLQNVLASLPAPIADPVTKEATVPDTTPADVVVDDVVKDAGAIGDGGEDDTDKGTEPGGITSTEPANDVEKAKGDPQVAVYDASGNLVGTIDPKDLSPIASATPPEGGDASGPDPVADEADLAPAPPADAGVPADAAPVAAPEAAPAVEPEPVEKSTEDVLKEMLDNALEAALQDHPVVKALKDEVEHLKAPAPSRVMSNGQLPPAHLLRGQDKGSGGMTVDVEKAAAAQTALTAATTVAEREAIAKSMNEDAAAYLAALREQSVRDRTRR